MNSLDRSTPPPISPIGNLVLPVPAERTLPNGARLSTLIGGEWDVCNLALLFPGGTFEAGNDTIPSLCAMLLGEGTANHTGEQINDFFDFHGAFFGASASEHFTTVQITWLTSMSQGLLPLLGEILASPTFPAEALAAYKQQAEAMLLAKQAKVSYQSQKAVARLIMGPDNPNAKITKPEEIRAVTAKDLKDWHRRTFTAAGCKAFLSGKFSEETVRQVEEFLMSLPSSCQPRPIKTLPFRPLQPQSVEAEVHGVVQCSVAMALPAPPRTSPDYIPLRFATMALGGYFGSRLMKNIREDKGYTYGIYSALLGGIDGSYVFISADTDKKYVANLIEETKKEIEAMATVPLSSEEVQCLVQHISADLTEILNTTFSIMDYYRTFVSAGIPDGYFQEQLRLLNALTPQAIMDISAKYLRPALLRIARTC